jgi:transposase
VHTLRTLAQRIQHLTTESNELEKRIKAVVQSHRPALLERDGVGPDSAATLLITAGDNPDRLHHEASFAALCGSSPTEASSGKTCRHRLDCGGDRQANRALHSIVLTRLRINEQAKSYLERRLAEGKTRREAVRCLKRYTARELYKLITEPLTRTT